jgi:hypothetical protein
MSSCIYIKSNFQSSTKEYSLKVKIYKSSLCMIYFVQDVLSTSASIFDLVRLIRRPLFYTHGVSKNFPDCIVY